ncbi:MAG: XisI protein [Coleofasciculaceae cyanobacterium]
MDKIAEYRQKIEKLLKDYAHLSVSDSEKIEAQTVFDRENNHYQVVHVGWSNNQRRIYGCSMHLDIKDGKVWIQHNATEFEIDKQLVELGIPKEDIVIGLHPPFMRQFTEYAVG